MNVVMAPDWRAGNPYQRLLAEALAAHGVGVDFPQGYRRGLPLARAMRGHPADLLHLHWPDAYFGLRRDGLDLLREWRFPLDLALTTRSYPLVATAHNLYPHNRAGSGAVRRNTRLYYRAARRIIVHGTGAIPVLECEFGVDPARCVFVPHGDLSVALPPLPPRAEARAMPGRDARSRCLMFGAVEPYKGIEEMIDLWRDKKPDAGLAIVGRPFHAEYGDALRARAAGVPMVELHLGWMSDADLALHLAAADAVIFNYRTILVSGAATLVRSLGIPMLLPARLSTLDLMEPHPLVFRFGDPREDLFVQLARALVADTGPDHAREWRTAHHWNSVAARTAAVYAGVLGQSRSSRSGLQAAL